MKHALRFTAVFAALFLGISTAQAKKLIVDDEVREVRAVKTAPTGNELRKIRRVAVGMTGAGPLGLGGVHVELNFSPESSFLAGFGGGPGYQAYNLEYKKILAGEWLLPYMAIGYARWMNFERKGPITETTPTVLGDRFLSDQKKASGKIDEYLLYPAFGLQYFQLDGPWAGFSVFVEVLALFDVEAFNAAPTGTLGVSYYF